MRGGILNALKKLRYYLGNFFQMLLLFFARFCLVPFRSYSGFIIVFSVFIIIPSSLVFIANFKTKITVIEKTRNSETN